MWPFIVYGGNTSQFLTDKTDIELFQFLKSEFKKKSNPDIIRIDSNKLIIRNEFPYRKSLNLVDVTDRIVFTYSNGKLKYKIYLIGMFIIHSVIGVIAGLVSNNLIVGIFIFLLIYLINYMHVFRIKKFINLKIKELQNF